MRPLPVGTWCMSLAVCAAVAAGTPPEIIVLTNGNTGQGQIISKDEQELVFQPEGTEPEIHLALNRIAKLVDVDEHGADKALASHVPPTWDIPAEPTAPPLVAAGKGPTYYLIPLHGEVGATILASALEKSLADAVKRKPTVVVLDIDSPGGLVDEAKKIAKVLHRYNKQLRIIAFTDQDLSAAAIITLSVKEIYVKSSSTIGAATSFIPTQLTLPPKLEEKMQSAWRAVARNSAEEGGHEPLLAEAMIDSDFELHLDTVNGKPVVHEGPGEKSLCRKGKILTLTSHEAVECGLAVDEADDLDELSKVLKLDGWTECKGLGTLLADYLPKRNEVFQSLSKQICAEFQQNCVRVNQLTPNGDVSQTVVQNGPRRYVRVGNTIRVLPGGPQRVVTNVSHARWYAESLQCVVALQKAEVNLVDEQALCKAFGQDGLADLVSQLAIDIGATRARIYGDRGRYGLPGPAAPPAVVAPPAAPQVSAPAPAFDLTKPRPPEPGSTTSADAFWAAHLPAERSPLIGRAEGQPLISVSRTRSPALGFRFSLIEFEGKSCVQEFRPVFRSSDLYDDPKSEVAAKPGYVVGGLTVEKRGSFTALRVLFVAYHDGHTDPSDTYKSDWIGQDAGYEKRDLGDGKRAVIGVYESRGIYIEGIGIVFAPTDPAAPAQEKARDTH